MNTKTFYFPFDNAESIENVKELIENLFNDLIENYKELMLDIKNTNTELYDRIQKALIADSLDDEEFANRMDLSFDISCLPEFNTKALEHYSQLADKYKLSKNLFYEYKFRFFDADLVEETEHDLAELKYTIKGKDVEVTCKNNTRGCTVSFLLKLCDYFEV